MEEPKAENQTAENTEEVNTEKEINQLMGPPQAEAQAEGEQPVQASQESMENSTQPAPQTEKKRGFKPSKKIMLFGALGLIIVVALAFAGWKFLLNGNTNETASSPTNKIVLLGAELSVVDGAVQTSKNNQNWQNAKVGDQVSQGMYLKTPSNGRVVIALDDGSAIRLNNNSVAKVNSLNTSNIVITNVSGEMYTRVVKSERKFSVVVAGENYVAMGTAYKTINTSDIKGVEVYESQVKLVKANLDVAEGKYYYDQSKDSATQDKLADILVDKVKQDAFMTWNYEQDKKSSEFNKSLGYLSKVYEATPTPTATVASTASVGLSGYKYDTGVKLKWSLNNVSAPKGFKLVKSLSANPTYGKDESVYISDPASRSYGWTIKDGKTYHFRVCIYTGSGCSLYSNDVAVTAPYVASAEPYGNPSLSHKGGQNFEWTFSGYAPNGFKLVWSTSSGPVYPGSANQYYSDPSTRNGLIKPTSGEYYVRVCLLGSNGCASNNYSNELKVIY